MPKVSVAIITYNQRHFIPETLQSVLEQDYDDFEIVVADDGSTDGSQELLLEYQRRYPERIKLVLSEQNQGITKNCNKAFFACTGEYIAWLGGDDLFYSGKLRAQVAALEANKDCSLCYHPVEVFDSDNGQILATTNLKDPYKQSLADVLWAGVNIASSSVLVRRARCPTNGFDESIPVASDWLFYLETLYHGCGLRVDGVYGAYRKHSNNVTNKSVIRDMEKSYLKVRSTKPELAKYVNRGLAMSYYSEGRKQLLSLNNQKAAQKNFRRAISTNPTFLPAWPWLFLSFLRNQNIATLRRFNQLLKRFFRGRAYARR